MLSRRHLIMAPAVLLGGCISQPPPVDFPILSDAETVEYRWSGDDPRAPSPAIDQARCAGVTAFVNRHRLGYQTVPYGPPIPRLTLYLRSEGKLLSAFGVGRISSSAAHGCTSRPRPPRCRRLWTSLVWIRPV